MDSFILSCLSMDPDVNLLEVGLYLILLGNKPHKGEIKNEKGFCGFNVFGFSEIFFLAVAVGVSAGPPEPASGEWWYTPHIEVPAVHGCNTHLITSEVSEWTGTFTGDSTEDARVIIHCSGNWSFKGTVDFPNVTITDQEGTVRTGELHMTSNGSRPDGDSDWFGYWTITEGSGELENLRGQGTFWVPGAPLPDVQGQILYSGNIHFEGN